MGFSRQESWSGQPFPSRGDLLDPGIEPTSLISLALAGGFFTTEPPGKPPESVPSHVHWGCWDFRGGNRTTKSQSGSALADKVVAQPCGTDIDSTCIWKKHSVLQSHPPHFKCSGTSCGQGPGCRTGQMFKKSHHHREFYWTFHSRSLRGCRENTCHREALHMLCESIILHVLSFLLLVTKAKDLRILCLLSYQLVVGCGLAHPSGGLKDNTMRTPVWTELANGAKIRFHRALVAHWVLCMRSSSWLRTKPPKNCFTKRNVRIATNEDMQEHRFLLLLWVSTYHTAVWYIWTCNHFFLSFFFFMEQRCFNKHGVGIYTVLQGSFSQQR